MTRTLFLIVGFLAVTVISFVWFVATWDRDAEDPISYLEPPHDAVA
ncbi:MAG: hypothetical protein AAGF78_00425 [Pseudomonadota bacterium]